MGNVLKSKAAMVFETAFKAHEQTFLKLKPLGLDRKPLYAIHQIFTSMDRDGSGEINLQEFFSFMDLTRTRFSERAFSIMDADGSGEVDFVEFVLAVWNYCSFNQTSLVRFAFDLYDLDGSGEIERAEAVRCIREIWGDAWERSANAHKILAKLTAIMEASSSGRVNVRQFQDFALHHPLLLFPAFQLQGELQHKILGQRFWFKAAKMRGEMDPRDLNWTHVQRAGKMSKQTSNRFLATLDDTHLELSTRKLSGVKSGGLLKGLSRRLTKEPQGSSSPAAVVVVAEEVRQSDTEHGPVETPKKRKKGKARLSSGGALVIEDLERT